MKEREAQIYAQAIFVIMKDSKVMEDVVITKPCVDSKYFINNKFKEEAPGIFTKTEKVFTQNPMTGQPTGELERTIKFKIFDVDSYLGTNIEFYIDNRLQIAGYWTDFTDFQTMFKI